MSLTRLTSVGAMNRFKPPPAAPGGGDPPPPPMFLGGVFPIGVDIQPPSLFATWKARGINTVVRVPDEPPPTGGPALPASINSWALAANAESLWQIRTPRTPMSGDFTDPTLLAWALPDEPDGITSQVPWETIQSMCDSWHATAPSIPVFLNVIGQMNQYDLRNGEGGPPWYAKYFAKVDWMSGDQYPINSGHALSTVPQMVDNLRALGPTKPVFAYIECCDINAGAGPAPTPGEMRAQIWSAIIRGVRGIFYFSISFVTGFSFDATPPNLVTEMTTQNARITSVANVLQTGINPAGYSAVSNNPALMIGWRVYNTDKYFLVLNFANATQTNATVNLTGIGGATTAVVVGESRSETITSGVITDTFVPYELHIYKVS